VAGHEIFPRLRLREVVLVLLVISAGVATLLVNVATSGHVKITGPASERLVKSGGSYAMSFPQHTSLVRARATALQPFPSNTRTVFYVEEPFCVTLIVRSPLLEYKVPPGVVDIEFLTTPKSPDALPYFNEKNVNTVLVTLSSSPDQRPSC